MASPSQSVVSPMKPMDTPDDHYLRAAQGWLELGDLASAEQELNQVSPSGRAHPLFLFVRWEFYAKTRQWPAAYLLSEYLMERCPEEPIAWLQRSYCLFAMQRIADAFQQLLPAAQKFPQASTIAYHLACYACQLGSIEEAWHWLDKAIGVGEADVIKSMALDDPILAPLWQQIGSCLSPAVPKV